MIVVFEVGDGVAGAEVDFGEFLDREFLVGGVLVECGEDGDGKDEGCVPAAVLEWVHGCSSSGS